MLLNDAGLDAIHEIGETILCLSRQGCNECGLHDLDANECSLDECVSRRDWNVPLDEVTHSRRVLRIESPLELAQHLD